MRGTTIAYTVAIAAITYQPKPSAMPMAAANQMAAAVVDRVCHHGRLLQFHGESYRVRHALMRGGSETATEGARST